MTGRASLSDQNKALVSGLYADIAAGRTEGLLSLIDPEIVIKEPSFLPYGGTYHGAEAFGELFGKISQHFELSSARALSVVADGEDVVALIELRTADGNNTLRIAEHFVMRGGLIAALTLYFHDLLPKG